MKFLRSIMRVLRSLWFFRRDPMCVICLTRKATAVLIARDGDRYMVCGEHFTDIGTAWLQLYKEERGQS